MAADNDMGASTPEELIFTAVITPHRSLSARGFALVMGAVAFANFVGGLLFFAIGAWPILAFMVLDVAIVYFAFRANYRSARARETVLVTGRQIVLRRVSARGVRAEWTFNPYWTRLAVRYDLDGEVERVAFVSHGARVPLAEWLSSAERARFTQALGAAIDEARRPPAPASGNGS